jgi:hypothetical protein
MFQNNFVRIAAAASTIAVAGQSIAVSAQVPPLPGMESITLQCCMCVDGSTQTRSIDTGTGAPWRVTPPNALPSQAAVQVPPGQIPRGWTNLLPARWVRHPAAVAAGDYVYQLRIMVPTYCVITPAAISVAGQYAAANGGSLQVNANPAVNTNPSTGFAAPTNVPVTALVPGLNIVRVRVNNLGGPTGLLVRAVVSLRCPTQPLPN